VNINGKKLMALYGLKWNPFLPDIPNEALLKRSAHTSFLWRVENLVMDGGIACVMGEPGTGKSVTMRLLDERLGKLREVTVARYDRPQSGMADFYRGLGELFGTELRVCNRFGGFSALRRKWKSHIDQTLLRPCLLIDEAQYVPTPVLSELRLLMSEQFDSRRILAVVLAGDMRLAERLKDPELVPLENRIRTRLTLAAASADELTTMLEHVLDQAGNRQLMTAGLIEAVVAHAVGNPRSMMRTCEDLLAKAVETDRPVLDEQLFFDLHQTARPKTPKASKAAS
jgi:type II secretory pathway predicted ATPase ExeA